MGLSGRKLRIKTGVLIFYRGKTFQARVLKRMVEVGFIDVETALLIVKEFLHLHVNGLNNADRLLYLLSFSREVRSKFHVFPFLFTIIVF